MTHGCRSQRTGFAMTIQSEGNLDVFSGNVMSFTCAAHRLGYIAPLPLIRTRGANHVQ